MVTNTEDDEDSLEDPIDYKTQYRSFKRKLKFLIYENECFQEALRSNQRRMLKVTRDRSFLLDRLLNYEKVEATSSEGDDTESSDDELGRADAKRRKLDSNHFSNSIGTSHGTSSSSKAPTPAKKKKPPVAKVVKSSSQPQLASAAASVESQTEAETRRQMMDLDKTPLPIPADMFSNEPSLDSESNELCDLETSPSNLGEDCLNNEYILPD